MSATVSVIPYLSVSPAAEAIEFYKCAFGAVETGVRMAGPDGKVMHCELRIGTSTVYLADCFDRVAFAEGRAPVTLHMEVPDADAAWQQALDAGATVAFPLENTFWGARYGQLSDPYGMFWAISHQAQQVSSEDAQKAIDAMEATC